MQSDGGWFGKVKHDELTPQNEGIPPDQCEKQPNSAYIRHYAIYIISSFGCVTNLLVIAVIIYTKRIRNSVPGVFLLGLTLADTVVLISEQMHNLSRSPAKSEKMYLTDNSCGFLAFSKYSSRFAATVIVLCISFNRLIVILYPLKCHGFQKVRNAVIQVCVIIVLSLVISGVYAFSVGSSPTYGCSANINEKLYNTAVTVVDVIFCDIIASILICMFSLCTVYKFRKYGQQFTQRQDSLASAVRKQSERHTTVLLLTVALTFVVLRVPYTLTWTPLKFMTNITDFSNNHPDQVHVKSLREATDIFQLLSLLNHAINLYLYCLCSRGFRNDIYRFFICSNDTRRDMNSIRMQTMSTRDRSKSTSKTLI